MYRLMIVAGPNRGSMFSLVEGENSIGRQMDNHIVLSSAKVSKRHCSLLVRSDEVFLRDEESTNGTFVNGALVRKQQLKNGDKVSVGDFVMELVQTGVAAQATPIEMMMSPSGGMPAMAGGYPAMGNAVSSAPSYSQSMPGAQTGTPARVRTVEAPQDLDGKLKFVLEEKIMPFFYGTLMKTEYRSVLAMVFAALTAISVIGAVMPMLDLAQKAIENEAQIRAKVIAREMADRFLPMIASHTESQIDLSLLESEDSVKIAAITTPNLQIIAPQSRLNQLFAGGREAAAAMEAAKQFKEGRERGYGGLVDDHTAIFMEPIKTTDPRQVKSQISAIAIVAIDFSSNMLAAGGTGVAYGIGFVVAGIAAVLAYFITLRLSLKPYEVLNDELDQVLRGELPRVTKEFKLEETEPLWNNVNAAVQRIPKGNSSQTSDFSFGGSDSPVDWDHEFAAVRAISEAASTPFVGFDEQLNLVAMNPQFDEVSGIHLDAIGQALSQVARDQGFVSLVTDLRDRVQSSPSRSALDQTEFQGMLFEVIATGAGPMSKTGIALVFRKKE